VTTPRLLLTSRRDGRAARRADARATHLCEGRARSEAGRRQGAAFSSLAFAAPCWPVSGWGGLKPGTASFPDSSVTTRPGWSGCPLLLPRPRTKAHGRNMLSKIKKGVEGGRVTV
jgi:hypothetical protein